MNTVDVLREAKAILSDQAAWGRGVLHCNRTGTVCALGAIGKVLGLDYDGLYEQKRCPYDVLSEHPAVIALSSAIGAGYGDIRADERVYEFNDDVHRAHHHGRLIDAFDRAILSLADKKQAARETDAAQAVAPVADAVAVLVGE